MTNKTVATQKSEAGMAVIVKPTRVRAACAAVLLACAAAPMAASALPVLPNALGYGISTPAGRGGQVIRVTTLAESGSGSLKACVDATGPRVCVFEVSGTIKMSSDLIIRNAKLTIAGQTAPSPGIMLRGGGLRIKASDVLVQHLRIRPGDDPSGEPPENRDALKFEADPAKPLSNVVVDHCSFSWSIDEIASAWQNWNNISLLNNIFAEPLNDSIHPKGPHGYGVLFGPVNGNVTFAGNLVAHVVSRSPLTNATNAVIVNNVVYNWQNMAVDLQSQKGDITRNSVVGNVFVKGPDYKYNSPILLRADATALPVGSKVYLEDNKAQGVTSDPWSIASAFNGALTLADFRASAPPSWPSGMTRLPTAGDVTLTTVLKGAGARPADRDSVDRRVVEHVRNGTGQIINCVAANGTTRCQKNAGGWPSLANNRRALTLPANPNTVTASGYTNLELWLHGMAAEVEGRPKSSPKSPVLAQSGN